MRFKTVVGIRVVAENEATRKKLMGILQSAYDTGMAEASMSATWEDVYKEGFNAGLTAFQHLVAVKG